MARIIDMQRVGDELHVTIALPAEDIAPRGQGTPRATMLSNLRKALKGVGNGDGNGAANGKSHSARS